MQHDFGDGKYTVVFEPDGRLYALRNGEPWQDFSGNKLLYCMLQEIDDLKAAQAQDRAELARLEAKLKAQPEVMDLHGVRRDGSVSVTLAKVGVDPKMKIKEFVSEFFGMPSDSPDEFDDAEMAEAAALNFYKWLQGQAKGLEAAAPRPWKITHDGDSLAMLEHKNRLFRIQEYNGENWVNADDNEELCESLAGVR
jgi:hypothetical protein